MPRATAAVKGAVRGWADQFWTGQAWPAWPRPYSSSITKITAP